MKPVLKYPIFFLIAGMLHSADFAGYSGSFLRMGTTARAIAMGSAFTAELDKGFSSYYNPAGTAFVESRQANFAHQSLPLNRRMLAAAFTMNLPPTAGVGIAWISAGADNIDGRTTSGKHTQYLSTSEDALMFTFSQKLRSWFAMGINVKILYHQLPMNSDNLTGSGIGFDLGIMIRGGNMPTLAFMVQDLNSSYNWNTTSIFEEQGKSYKELFPTIYRVGSTYTLGNFFFVGDLGMITDQNSVLGYSIRLGTEYTYKDHYFLRVGYGNSRASVGAGLNWSFAQKNDAYLDYAFVIEYPAGSAHIFTYAFHF
ncbi:MAG: PorV/PorQ family protein [Candidatus Marinimicrobia bacterium]|nr:PorV/PorQ family protein [Candidatus Neomarinimicrobiota bacterium]MDP7072661.1 PorV/PorQ family protein [Candidatus Neomarinimicrobiota bacterium]